MLPLWSFQFAVFDRRQVHCWDLTTFLLLLFAFGLETK